MKTMELLIRENLSVGAETRYRERKIVVDSESLTLGSHQRADILLRQWERPFLIEIKFDANEWWLVNPDRHEQLSLNGKSVDLAAPLQSQDEIQIQGHSILVNRSPTAILPSPTFPPRMETDEALWNYLVEDTTYDEILINGDHPIWVDFSGHLFQTPWTFSDPDFVLHKIQSRTGKASGWVSWQEQGLKRFHGALPPLVDRPHLAIRKARERLFSLQELEDSQFGTPEEIQFLKKAVSMKRSIVISGGTSSGKTSLMRTLVASIPKTERCVIIEEEREARWDHPHAVVIEAGRDQLRQAVKESLRLRPDRLIISEIRSTEAFQFVQAINTGHPGSMTTVHANSPREALFRIESLALSENSAVSLRALRRQLSQAIQVICQVCRTEAGQRQIQEIVEVSGIEGDMILLSSPVGSRYEATKASPTK